MVDKKLMAEFLFAKRLMNEIAPTGILSYVADSYDFWSVVTKIIPALKEDIMARDGKFVIRPDSGNPVDILCGKPVVTFKDEPEDFETWKLEVAEKMNDLFCEDLNPLNPTSKLTNIYRFKGERYLVTYTPDLNRHDKTYYYVDNYGSTVSKCTFFKQETLPEDKGLIEVLWDIFGGTYTSKGFKMLDEHIGAIYGDSITLERQREIYQRLMDKGFAPEPVLGVGSYSFQYVTRDTHGSAVKATNVVKNGVDVAIAKDPKTDSGKKSAKGLLKVYRDEDGNIVMKDQCTREEENEGLLQTVFEDGKVHNLTTLEEIRKLIESQL